MSSGHDGQQWTAPPEQLQPDAPTAPDAGQPGNRNRNLLIIAGVVIVGLVIALVVALNSGSNPGSGTTGGTVADGPPAAQTVNFQDRIVTKPPIPNIGTFLDDTALPDYHSGGATSDGNAAGTAPQKCWYPIGDDGKWHAPTRLPASPGSNIPRWSLSFVICGPAVVNGAEQWFMKTLAQDSAENLTFDVGSAWWPDGDTHPNGIRPDGSMIIPPG